MAINFNIVDMPKPTHEEEVSAEQIAKITKRVQKASENLRKKMKRIARKEYEAWKHSSRRG